MANVSISPIKRILIANRGEIARRIIRTAHEMGISTVAIYADGDMDAPFVKEADTAIALNGRTSTETYLDVEKVLSACKQSGADAVHPGYGFLSENTNFAEAVSKAGVTWVGPSPDAISQMGDKLSAKRLMEEAKVPTLPSVELTAKTKLDAAAEKIGYPVLIKASAGGGGKGMRVVESPEELEEAAAAAKREAGSAFGDDTLFLEKWVTSSRHVEIQILGDQHGQVVHCFERECSIQRRHQKIIEEAPSPAVSDDLRKRMGDAAIAAAKKIGYTSAGTVEFLLSGDEFWFLEVNTRLQVEHPITEEITGLDLVREQIRIAEGEKLSFTQDDLTINGHAIEARLYAEDPEKDFLPSPGTVEIWTPSQKAGARFDSGVESGSEVSIDFDPMIAKVIVHAPTRREATSRLARVLETTRVQGLTTNRDFLVTTLRTDEFISGDTTTDFIERVNPGRSRIVSENELRIAGIMVAMEAQAIRRAEARVLQTIQSGWRNSTMPAEKVGFRYNEEEFTIRYRSCRDGSFSVYADDTNPDEMLRVRILNCGSGQVELEVDTQRFFCAVSNLGNRWLIHSEHGDIELEELPRFPVKGAADFTGGLMAPMPGSVLKTQVRKGDKVEKGQLVLVLEAMKMEHQITAPTSGTITELHVNEGDQVDNGQLLAVLEEDGKQDAEKKEA